MYVCVCVCGSLSILIPRAVCPRESEVVADLLIGLGCVCSSISVGRRVFSNGQWWTLAANYGKGSEPRRTRDESGWKGLSLAFPLKTPENKKWTRAKGDDCSCFAEDNGSPIDFPCTHLAVFLSEQMTR